MFWGTGASCPDMQNSPPVWADGELLLLCCWVLLADQASAGLTWAGSMATPGPMVEETVIFCR